MRNKSTFLALILIFAAGFDCGGSGSNGSGGSEPIGSEGGIYEFEDGASIEIPAGALDEGAEVSITYTEIDPGVTEGWWPLGPIFNFSPKGVEFAVPITVTLPYNPNLFPGELDESDAVIMFQEDDGDWENREGMLDTENNLITVEITELGIFGAGIEVCPDEDGDGHGKPACGGDDCDDDDPDVWSNCGTAGSEAIIINHLASDIELIPASAVEQAGSLLHVAYGHTSHGSQITTGMQGLVDFRGDLYEFNRGGTEGALDLWDQPFSGASDLGNPDRTAWEEATRDFLDDHPEYNVIIWSWCGQVSSATDDDIDTYLGLMAGLEEDYPNVMFVYMTGHVDGTGLDGNLHLRNNQIRDYCRDHDKVLYDFADIEVWDPDGNYFGDKIPNDNCDYDSDDNGTRDSNWAIEWQETHTEGADWYRCSSAHSQPLNANLKAYAAWWLWARLAGWDGT